MMRTYRMSVAYDGTAYAGWQRQSTLPSVQQTLEDACHKIFRHPANVQGAGRTDAGAHAYAQSANVQLDTDWPERRIRHALNGVLPHDIVVTDMEETAPSFHARFDAASRTYQYVILNQPDRDPFSVGRAYHVKEPLQVNAMRQAARAWIGRHDFSSFCTSRADVPHAVRTLKALKIERQGARVVLTMTADGFLRGMIRTMVQTLVEVGREKVPPSHAKVLLVARDRRVAPKAAPAHGLYLIKVSYENVDLR